MPDAQPAANLALDVVRRLVLALTVICVLLIDGALGDYFISPGTGVIYLNEQGPLVCCPQSAPAPEACCVALVVLLLQVWLIVACLRRSPSRLISLNL